MIDMKVRVEYESTPIRHIAVECPNCNNWFHARDILDGDWIEDLRYDYQIEFATFVCPVCRNVFGYVDTYNRENVEIKEVGSSEECYKDCLSKREVWE